MVDTLACLKSRNFDVMKWIKVLCYIFLAQAVVSGSEESESLRVILDKSITPGELREDLLAQSLSTWKGLRTLAGVEAVYDLRINTTRGDEKLAGGFICDRFEVPRNEVTTFLLDKCEQSKNDPYLLMRYSDFLTDYDDDIRVPRYYASLLSDKRQQNRNFKPKDGWDELRVCDNAITNLIGWAIKHASLKMGDPAFDWDALHEADFEKNIVAIRPYLIEQGVIEASKKSAGDLRPSHQRTETDSEGAGNTRQVKRGVPESKESANLMADNIEIRAWKAIAWGMGGVGVLSLIWLYLKKRKLRE